MRYLMLAAAMVLLCPPLALSKHQPNSNLAAADLAFVSPAGGAALPAGQAFYVKLQAKLLPRRIYFHPGDA
jgi:hypothetical protein